MSYSQKESDANSLARQLASGSSDESASAKQRLASSEEGFRHLVINRLAENAVNTRSLLSKAIWLFGGLSACTYLFALWMGDKRAMPDLAFAPSILVFCAILYLFLQRLPRQYGALFSALAAYGDANRVGLLIDAITFPVRKDVRIWRQALESSIALAPTNATGVARQEQLARLAGLLAVHWDSIGQNAQSSEERTLLAITLAKTLARLGGSQEMERLEELAAKTPRNQGQTRLRDYIIENMADWKAQQGA